MKRRLYQSLLVMALACCLMVSPACRQSSARVEGDQAPPVVTVEDPTVRRVIEAAVGQVSVTKRYDPAYVKLAYPNGDVPLETGVCSDVLIRAFRAVGVDLQKEVHEDMRRSFAV